MNARLAATAPIRVAKTTGWSALHRRRRRNRPYRRVRSVALFLVHPLTSRQALAPALPVSQPGNHDNSQAVIYCTSPKNLFLMPLAILAQYQALPPSGLWQIVLATRGGHTKSRLYPEQVGRPNGTRNVRSCRQHCQPSGPYYLQANTSATVVCCVPSTLMQVPIRLSSCGKALIALTGMQSGYGSH